MGECNRKGIWFVLNLFGKKNREVSLSVPLAGKVIELEQVPDEVFARKIMGDGIAVEPDGCEVVAPCAGEIILVAETKHAVALKTDGGLEILIHIGLDTVELAGEGFLAHVHSGDKVQQGAKLITFDQEFLVSRGKSLVTPLVITNMEKVKQMEKNFLPSGGEVLKIILK
ncbi:MAG: PTS glucose transporter subunit IIA [Sporomusaceae bacterium]|jgi:glucose-specific phosphotransferase system IIA component|nr:PTS glucose transporter subunit IIA [Sporomusaceae bacterium]